MRQGRDQQGSWTGRLELRTPHPTARGALSVAGTKVITRSVATLRRLTDHGPRVRSVIRPKLLRPHASWAIPGTRTSSATSTRRDWMKTAHRAEFSYSRTSAPATAPVVALLLRGLLVIVLA